jgi:hypothetical protein
MNTHARHAACIHMLMHWTRKLLRQSTPRWVFAKDALLSVAGSCWLLLYVCKQGVVCTKGGMYETAAKHEPLPTADVTSAGPAGGSSHRCQAIHRPCWHHCAADYNHVLSRLQLQSSRPQDDQGKLSKRRLWPMRAHKAMRPKERINWFTTWQG